MILVHIDVCLKRKQLKTQSCSLWLPQTFQAELAQLKTEVGIRVAWWHSTSFCHHFKPNYEVGHSFKYCKGLFLLGATWNSNSDRWSQASPSRLFVAAWMVSININIASAPKTYLAILTKNKSKGPETSVSIWKNNVTLVEFPHQIHFHRILSLHPIFVSRLRHQLLEHLMR